MAHEDHGWKMVAMRLPPEAVEVLDAFKSRFAGPTGLPSRSAVLLYALGHLKPLAEPEIRALAALEAHVESLGLGLTPD